MPIQSEQPHLLMFSRAKFPFMPNLMVTTGLGTFQGKFKTKLIQLIFWFHSIKCRLIVDIPNLLKTLLHKILKIHNKLTNPKDHEKYTSQLQKTILLSILKFWGFRFGGKKHVNYNKYYS